MKAWLAMALLLAPDSRPARSPGPCRGAEASVVVDTRQRGLFLCEGGQPLERFTVAVGRGGTGKQARGDLRTPLGTYPLGAPRPSRRYGIFIPVGYPTPAQQRQGLTGTAVGIHGPARALRWLGPLNTFYDWTAGCVVVGSDAEMDRIAGWVLRRRPAAVEIR
ncbi:MAG TPA: L,D-transpeptidase [Anaeromyxobacteraceae bacterium]|nr:L,D-transpeptidase [Anaeromyxobacteraceae bacterium]